MWYIWILNICFVSCIKNDQSIILKSIVYPFFKLIFAKYSSRRVIGVT